MQSNPREFQTVVLAALLHDIGKFLQRGRSLSFDIEGRHPEVSARFVRAFAETFRPVADVDLLGTLVLRHHRGQGFGDLSADGIEDPRQRSLAFLVNKRMGCPLRSGASAPASGRTSRPRDVLGLLV